MLHSSTSYETRHQAGPARIIPKSSYQHLAWRNGQGFTEEVAIYPPDAQFTQGEFLWRISSAKIEQASSFSTFPNHDRILLILKGGGVNLFHQSPNKKEVKVPLLLNEPYGFSGDVSTRCELLGSTVTDLNIFTQKKKVSAQITVREFKNEQPFLWSPQGTWNFAFSLSRSFSTPVGSFDENDTLYSAGAIELKALNPRAKLLLIELHSHYTID